MHNLPRKRHHFAYSSFITYVIENVYVYTKFSWNCCGMKMLKLSAFRLFYSHCRSAFCNTICLFHVFIRNSSGLCVFFFCSLMLYISHVCLWTDKILHSHLIVPHNYYCYCCHGMIRSCTGTKCETHEAIRNCITKTQAQHTHTLRVHCAYSVA